MAIEIIFKSPSQWCITVMQLPYIALKFQHHQLLRYYEEHILIHMLILTVIEFSRMIALLFRVQTHSILYASWWILYLYIYIYIYSDESALFGTLIHNDQCQLSWVIDPNAETGWHKNEIVLVVFPWNTSIRYINSRSKNNYRFHPPRVC